MAVQRTFLPLLALLVTACGGGAAVPRQAPPSAAPKAVDAAHAAAAQAADGKRIGGTVSILGVLSGPYLTAYLSTFKPFEEATGITIKYEGTQDLTAVLQTRIAGGNPPDVVSNPSAGQIHSLAVQGKLIALDGIVDVAAVRKDFPAGLVELGSADGKLYALPGTSAVAGLVWYDPKSYQGPTTGTLSDLDAWVRKSADAGKTPWCIGLESGPTSGWPGAVWIQQFMVQQAGADAYNQWWQGRLPWTSPQVRAAFAAFGAYATDAKLVSGGSKAVLTANFAKSPVGLFSKPPACYLHVQNDWLGNSMAQTVPDVQPVRDIDFFPFPATAAGRAPALVTSGEMFGALRDTPQTRALMRYVASPAFSSLIAGTGQWIGPSRRTALADYTSVLSRKAAELYTSAETVVYGAQDGMPAPMSAAFHKSVVAYVRDPGSLDRLLAELDQVQKTAY
ncbi:ABC transporter substrate-binding protein [Acrocarpospora catenulata]|uniref:ABC transporter substrate-binding protein n=1 Tax=Acrocarpospora catenulata TaxID=2836182 RepID=UPI001BDA6BF2|nr:extracellular solute-binding protein [Acrocarpospora catenulata]